MWKLFCFFHHFVILHLLSMLLRNFVFNVSLNLTFFFWNFQKRYCSLSFKVRNLELFTITLYSQYQPLLLSAEGGGGGGGGRGGSLQSQILKKGADRKKWVPGGSSLCHSYLPVGLTMFLVKKDFIKWNMVLRAQFLNVSLGLL